MRPNALVLDPFAGTGSILVAAAATAGGVFTTGCDIDDRVLVLGKQGRTVASNFRQYRLQQGVPELVLMDSSRRSCVAHA